MAEHPVRQAVPQPQPVPPERQVGGAVIFDGRRAGRAHDLEATVQQERMDIQPVRAELGRERNLSQRLTWPGPERVERAERLTEIDPHAGLGSVVGRQVDRREGGPHAL